MKATRFVNLFTLAVFVAAPALAQDNDTLATITATEKVVVAKPVLPSDEKARINPLSVIVDLGDNKEIRGALTDATTIDLKTSFGQVNLPLTEIAGIKLADDNNATTTIIMHNGDSVTGATDIQRLTVETEWGTATINGSNVRSVLLAPGLRWSSDSGLNGVRWELVSENKATSASQSTLNNRASSATSSSSVISSQPVYSGSPAFSRPVIINPR